MNPKVVNGNGHGDSENEFGYVHDLGFQELHSLGQVRASAARTVYVHGGDVYVRARLWLPH